MTCNAATPTLDPLLNELKCMKPIYKDPMRHVPTKDFLHLANLHITPLILRKLTSPLKTAIELMTGGGTTAAGKQSNSKGATTKSTSSKPPVMTKRPAAKADEEKMRGTQL